MIDFGKHAGSIWWAYGVVILVTLGLVFWSYYRDRKIKALLDEVENRDA